MIKDTVISVDAMKADGGVEVEFHSFSTYALGVDHRSPSYPSQLTVVSIEYQVGWGPRTKVNALVEEKPADAGNQNTIPQIFISSAQCQQHITWKSTE